MGKDATTAMPTMVAVSSSVTRNPLLLRHTRYRTRKIPRMTPTMLNAIAMMIGAGPHTIPSILAPSRKCSPRT